MVVGTREELILATREAAVLATTEEVAFAMHMKVVKTAIKRRG